MLFPVRVIIFSPGIPTTINTMGVFSYLRGLIIEIGSSILLVVVEGEGIVELQNHGFHGFVGQKPEFL